MTVLLEYVIVVHGGIGPAGGAVGAGIDATGVGAGVIPGGQAVMIAGLFGTDAAQSPVR